MIQPERIGRYQKVDDQGYVIPDARSDLIPNLYLPVVSFGTREALVKLKATSVYLRGSVPRGLAIPGHSDIDFLYVSEHRDAEAEQETETAIQAQFPFVKSVELGHVSPLQLTRIHPPQTRPYLEMLLKTQSLWIAGRDVVAQSAPFKCGVDLIGHVFILEREFLKLKDDEPGTRKWFCRRLLRSGLEITLDRVPQFTRDLSLCFEQFAELYPDHAAQMQAVLLNALNGHEPLDRYQKLVQFVSHEARARYKVAS